MTKIWYVWCRVARPTGEVVAATYLVAGPTKPGAARVALKLARRMGRVEEYETYGPCSGSVVALDSIVILKSNEHVAANGKPIDGYPLQEA